MGEEVCVSEMTKNPLSSSSSSSSSSSTTRSRHLILVHGVSHGAWCWYKVRTLLEASGHTVTCFDLKASGIDRSDVDSIHSFQEYNQPLVDLMSSLPPHHKVILVGHSAGGISVTDAIHKFPDKIEAAIYVAASMLNLGFQTDQDIKDGAPDISEFGDAIELGFGLGEDQPPTSAFVKQQSQRQIFYHLSPLEDSTLASMLLRPFPLAVTEAKLEEGKESSEKVPRIYIKTLQDRVIKPEQQDAMIKRWPPLQVYTLDTDHSPFFSSPFVLSGLLAKVAHSL